VAAPQPNYFAGMQAEVGRLIHAVNNAHSTTAANIRYLNDASLRGLSADQVAAIRDAHDSAEATSVLLRELRTLLLG
jgi:hypothetical protein